MSKVPKDASSVPAIIYAAKSTKDPRGSIQTQLADGRAMAEREGWEVEGEYTDEAASAWKGNRGPGLASAMEHAERIVPAILVVQHSDRLARGDGKKARHLGQIYFWANEHDVEIRSAQDDSTFTNPLLAFAMGERNAEDSRRKSLAVRAGHQRRRERGLHNSRAPYGYRYEDGRIFVVPEEAEVVRRVFRDWLGGISQYAIAQALNREGVPTRKVTSDWHQGTISQMLRNPRLAGLDADGEGPCGCGHEAIVSPEDFARAQAMLGDCRKPGAPGRRSAAGHLLLNGFLRCGLCGDAMLPRSDARSGYAVYYCQRSRTHGRESCSMPLVRREVIDGMLVEHLKRRHLDVREMIERHEANVGGRIAEVEARSEAAQREALRAVERLARVKRDYQDGRLDAEDWRGQRGELEAERTAAEKEAERLGDQAGDLRRSLRHRDAESEVLAVLATIRESVIGPDAEAATVDGIRAGLRSIWSGLRLYPAGSEEALALSDSGAEAPVLVPVDLDGSWASSPSVRVPLPMPTNSYVEGLTT